MILDASGAPYVQTKASNPLARVEYFPAQVTHGRPRPRNYTDLLKRYESWVHHCAWINAQALSEVPYRLYVAGVSKVPTAKVGRKSAEFVGGLPHARRKAALAGGQFEEVLDHPALDVLDKPNPYMTTREFRQYCELYRGLCGNCYVWKEPGPLGVTVGLWPVNPAWMTIVPGVSTMVAGYIYEYGTQKVAFGPDEIIHMKRPNPSDPYHYGYGETESEADIVALDDAITSFELYTMQNNARPDFVLESEMPISPEQIKDLQRDWRRLYGGISNANKVAILSGGLKAKPMNFSPKEVSYIAGEDRVMRRIGMAFGIPKSMLTTDDVNLANAEIGERQHAKYTLLPRLSVDCEILTDQWIADYDSKLFLGFDSPVREDAKTMAEVDTLYITASVVTPNEIRAQRFNLPPLDGGDETAATRTERQSQQRADAQAQAMQAMQAQQGQNQPPPKKPDDDDKKGTKAVTDESGLIDSMAAAMRGVFRSQLRDLLGVPKGAKAIVPMDGDLTPYEVEQIQEQLEMFRAGWASDTGKAIGPHVARGIQLGGEGGLATLARYGADVAAGFDVYDPRVSEFIDNYKIRLSERITDTTIVGRLNPQIKASLEAGERIPQLRNRIMGVYESFSKSRAEMIARSEASRTEHAGQIESWRQSGEVAKMVWAMSDSACEYCAALNGQEVGMKGGSFAEMGAQIAGVDADGKPTGNHMTVNYESIEGTGGISSPPAHPHCRCTLIPVLMER